MPSVNVDLVRIALEKVEGFAFERFAQDFMAAVDGKEFSPLGGVGDGGADGVYCCGDERRFYQFSVQDNYRDKIRKTVARLRQYGRLPRSVVYVTSVHVPAIDRVEDDLGEELDVRVRIRDAGYILSHINASSQTVAAYENHLRGYVDFLRNLSVDEVFYRPKYASDPSVFVFLQHEVTNRLGNRKLVHSLTDSLIFWALADTDPEKGIFKTEDEIRSVILSSFSWAEKILKPHFRPRLNELSRCGKESRAIRWYPKEKKYCLPFAAREAIKENNAEDKSLESSVRDEFKDRACMQGVDDAGKQKVLADLALAVIHKIFSRQGLLFAHFLSSVGDGVTDQGAIPLPPVVPDCISEALGESAVLVGDREEYRDIVESIIRAGFYDSTTAQRKYFQVLSRAYVLFFTLQAEPKVLEYFSNMSASFKLYLGSDILVKALSERYLEAEDRAARNMLRIAREAGIELYLSECVLDEVYTHVRGTYYEFVNYFAEAEPYVTSEIARNSGKILIRAYFDAKLGGVLKGGSWRSFLGQFVSYENIETSAGREEIRKYLMVEYGLKFTSNEELERVSNSAEVTALAEKLSKDNDKHEALSYNAALLVHGIYGLRRAGGEVGGVSEFGYKTWWLTNRVRILERTNDIVRAHRSRYIMRPEFVLNFIAMAPSCEKARENLGSLLPSGISIDLGSRVKDDAFHDIMRKVKEWHSYEPGRVVALVSELSDQLKSDRLKEYEFTLADAE